MPNKADTVTRLRSGTENMCFRASIFAQILKLTVQIASIFSQPYSDRGGQGGGELLRPSLL